MVLFGLIMQAQLVVMLLRSEQKIGLRFLMHRLLPIVACHYEFALQLF